MERDILQSVKLEFAKNLKFTPYVRMWLHHIIGISNTDTARSILRADLQAEPAIRFSALRTIAQNAVPGFTDTFHELLQQSVTPEEIAEICFYLRTHGNEQTTRLLKGYILDNYTNPEKTDAVIECLETARTIPHAHTELPAAVRQILKDENAHQSIRSYAMRALSIYNGINEPGSFPVSDEFLSETFDAIAFASRQSINQRSQNNENPPPHGDDNFIIEQRVYLSKLLSRFESFSTHAKISCINALILSKHRETNAYITKMLAGDNEKEKEQLLLLLQHTIHILREPEPFIRSLISLGTVSSHHNALIADIVTAFLNKLPLDRAHAPLKDKIFNYLTISLDSFFELYRKKFMISEVEENNFPDAVRHVRNFILARLSPELLNRIVHYLRYSTKEDIHKIIPLISGHIQTVDSEPSDAFSLFIDLLYDSDPKSREITASRLESIDFEKRMLRERIVRLCSIIARVHIQSASGILVKIYNYLKKYPDEILYDSCIRTLSIMQYPYMFGELELMLISGKQAEQLVSVRYLGYYNNHQAAAVFFELLKNAGSLDKEVMTAALQLAASAETWLLTGNSEILLNIFESHDDIDIKRHAIACLGKCAGLKELEWLISLFGLSVDAQIKEAILLSMLSIIVRHKDFNRRALIQFSLDCLKESGIRLRMYACVLLLQCSYKEVGNHLREMLVIKNRDIQAELLYIIQNYSLPEFSYFLLLLLQEEYALGYEIISFLRNSPADILDEIAAIIGTIYRKNGIDISSPSAVSALPKPGLTAVTSSYYTASFSIDTAHYIYTPYGIISSLKTLQMLIADACKKYTIPLYALLPHSVIAYSKNAESMARMLLDAKHAIDRYNLTASIPFKAVMQCCRATAVDFTHDVLIITNNRYQHDTLHSYIIIDESLYASIHNEFFCSPMPHILASPYHVPIYHLVSMKNAQSRAQKALDEIILRDKIKKDNDQQLLEELKRKKIQMQSQGSADYLATLERVNAILRNEINDINKYIQKRSTDRELNAHVSKMLETLQKKIFLEISNFIMK